MEARDVASAFRDALTARDFPVARALLAQDVRFQMLLPIGFKTESEADGAIGRFIHWFGDADSFDVETSNVGELEGREAVSYRFRLHDADGWQAIEQHLMIDVRDGLITGIDLLCSGFRSITACEPARVHRFDAGDLGCADGLAGEFRTQMQQIPLGDVLVVSTRDPAAKEDLPPLARMMGHAVRSIEAPGDGRLLVSVERGR